MQRLPTLDRYFILCLGIFSCSLLIAINYFIAPLSDESLPVATALRFVQGQIPFVDDYSPYISLGLFLYPFVKLSLWINQGTNELILFLRHFYLVFVLLICGYSFCLTRKNLSFILAAFTALAIAIFHPFGLNNFHYDTLATLLWSNILFQFYNFQLNERIKKSHLLLFSLQNLVLCLAYPTFAFFLILFFFSYTIFHRHSKPIIYFHILIAGLSALGLSWLIFFYFNISTQDIYNTAQFSQRLFSLSSTHGVFYKLTTVIKDLLAQYQSSFLMSSCILLVGYFTRKHWFILPGIFFIALMVPFFKIMILQATYNEAFYVINLTGLLSFPIFILFLRKDKAARTLFLFIGIPSFAAGLLTSATSYNLSLNFIIGFFPAFILTWILIFSVYQHHIPSDKPLLKWALTRVFLALGLLELVFFQWNYIYGAPQVGLELYKNTIRIQTTGPFKNLFVTTQTHQLITQLQKDIESLDSKANPGEFAYFGTFSAGYLFLNHLKPGEYLLFSSYKHAHFGEKIRTPSYVFDFSKFWQLPTKDDIKNYLQGDSFVTIATTSSYDIYASEHSKVASNNRQAINPL